MYVFLVKFFWCVWALVEMSDIYFNTYRAYDHSLRKCIFPGKIVTFPSDFPLYLMYFFISKVKNFPPNGQISEQEASQIAHLFPP